MSEAAPRLRILGIDFSGASDAGRRIWIADGIRRGGALDLTDCFQARRLAHGHAGRDEAFAALNRHIAALGAAVIGIDVPFGIAQPLLPFPAACWIDVLRGFLAHWPKPEDFRRACRLASPAAEIRRATDRESRTPFAPQNLRLYRMTWHGIAGLIAPLVLSGRVRAVPMQEADPALPVLMETCPASFLKRRCPELYRAYKGRTAGHRGARAAILERLEQDGLLLPPHGTLRESVLDDPGGDALDAVIAGVIVVTESADPQNLLPRQAALANDLIEARVYF